MGPSRARSSGSSTGTLPHTPPDPLPSAPDTVLRSLATRNAATLTVGVLDAPGHAVLVTRELYEALQQADR